MELLCIVKRKIKIKKIKNKDKKNKKNKKQNNPAKVKPGNENKKIREECDVLYIMMSLFV